MKRFNRAYIVVGQALLAKRLGKKRIIAETGAGQHGVATATICAKLGLECIVYMGYEDVQRQSLNVFRMYVCYLSQNLFTGKCWELLSFQFTAEARH